MINTGCVTFATDPAALTRADAICDIRQRVKPGAVVVLESTTYTGTTEEILGTALARAGFSIGNDIFVAFSPERVDLANPVFRTKNTLKVMGGSPLFVDESRLRYMNAL